MTEKRMIYKSMFEDDFISSLDMTGRYLWVGLIVAVADDQGRGRDNQSLIKSKVFPLDAIEPDEIEGYLQKMADNGKITRYQDGNKRLFQIVHWWNYQMPAWACESAFPAPGGWVDRARYHGKGQKLITCNWDKKGGYSQDEAGKVGALRNAQGRALPSAQGRVIDKSKRREREEERREAEGGAPAAAPTVILSSDEKSKQSEENRTRRWEDEIYKALNNPEKKYPDCLQYYPAELRYILEVYSLISTKIIPSPVYSRLEFNRWRETLQGINDLLSGYSEKDKREFVIDACRIAGRKIKPRAIKALEPYIAGLVDENEKITVENGGKHHD